jgi:hypothetical protein
MQHSTTAHLEALLAEGELAPERLDDTVLAGVVTADSCRGIARCEKRLS